MTLFRAREYGMKEPQRLAIERDLATARRAIYRAIESSDRAALMATGDCLRQVNEELREIMDAVMRKREPIYPLPTSPAYL
jgi:hypothetical protein